MIGGSLFYDFARVGATPARFQSFVLSAGVVTDYVYGAGMHWQGGCGGVPCDGSGSLNEWNVIGELKAATALGGGNTLNGYIGAGAAIFWPSGHPTGGTTSFLGSATAPAVRIGWGMDLRAGSQVALSFFAIDFCIFSRVERSLRGGHTAGQVSHDVR